MNSGSWSSFQAALPPEAQAGGEPDDYPLESGASCEERDMNHREYLGQCVEAIDMAHEKLETLVKCWGEMGATQKRYCVRQIEKMLDRKTNPRLRTDLDCSRPEVCKEHKITLWTDHFRAGFCRRCSRWVPDVATPPRSVGSDSVSTD